jgi:hypothetical protein
MLQLNYKPAPPPRQLSPCPCRSAIWPRALPRCRTTHWGGRKSVRLLFGRLIWLRGIYRHREKFLPISGAHARFINARDECFEVIAIFNAGVFRDLLKTLVCTENQILQYW